MRTTFLLFVPAVMARDDWNTLWWLPSDGDVTPGKQVASHKTMPHLMFIPAGTPPTDGWPLLVFLHGQGESSPTPLPRVAIQGPPQTCGRAPGTMKMAVLSPQKPMSSQFYDNDVADDIEALVDHYVASQKLDGRRIYLTGLSQGSIGTWNLAAARPSRWAAIAPVSGGLRPPFKEAASALKDMPIWAFHAPNDVILPVAMSDKSVDACKRLATRTAELKYTRDEAGGSDPSWAAAGIPDMPGHGGMNSVAYYPQDSPPYPLYEWLLQFRRNDKRC
jgi:predicted peptidase